MKDKDNIEKTVNLLAEQIRSLNGEIDNLSRRIKQLTDALDNFDSEELAGNMGALASSIDQMPSR